MTSNLSAGKNRNTSNQICIELSDNRGLFAPVLGWGKKVNPCKQVQIKHRCVILKTNPALTANDLKFQIGVGCPASLFSELSTLGHFTD
ncbi:hypothetical protein FKM82_014330 [Ascaphus truei]